MSSGRLLLGVGLLLLGGLLLLDQLELVDAGEVLATFWPLILIAIGILQFITNPQHWFPPTFLILLGLMFLAVQLDVVSGDAWGAFWAGILVMAGIWILLGVGPRRGHDVRDDATVYSFVAFSGRDLASRSSAFEGGSITTLFGGTEVDLEQATMAGGQATVSVLTAFGGTSIVVPRGWYVRINGLPLFGGWSNGTRKEPVAPDAPRLDVNATVMFGGLDVDYPDGRPYP